MSARFIGNFAEDSREQLTWWRRTMTYKCWNLKATKLASGGSHKRLFATRSCFVHATRTSVDGLTGSDIIYNIIIILWKCPFCPCGWACFLLRRLPHTEELPPKSLPVWWTDLSGQRWNDSQASSRFRPECIINFLNIQHY